MKRSKITREGLEHNIYNVLLSNGNVNPYISEYEFTNRSGIMEDVPGKGDTDALLSTLLFERFNEVGIETHFAGVGTTSNSMLVWKCKVAQLKIVVRNMATEEFCERNKGYVTEEEEKKFENPIIEFFYPNKNPVATSVLVALGIVTLEELGKILIMMKQVNAVATKFFDNLGLTLVEFEAEVGRNYRKELMLAGAFTQDTCTLWDTSGDKIDKDVFKKSNVLDAEEAVYRKMMQILKTII